MILFQQLRRPGKKGQVKVILVQLSLLASYILLASSSRHRSLLWLLDLDSGINVLTKVHSGSSSLLGGPATFGSSGHHGISLASALFQRWLAWLAYSKSNQARYNSAFTTEPMLRGQTPFSLAKLQQYVRVCLFQFSMTPKCIAESLPTVEIKINKTSEEKC